MYLKTDLPPVTEEEWAHFRDYSFPRSEAVVPKPIAPVVGGLLPAIQNARRRWPLWTYERRSPADLDTPVTYQDRHTRTWYDPEAWPHRLGWSPIYTVSDFSWLKELREQFPFLGAIGWFPSAHLALVFIDFPVPDRFRGKLNDFLDRYVVPVPTRTKPASEAFCVFECILKRAWLTARLPLLPQARSLAGAAQTDLTIPTSIEQITLPDFLNNYGLDRNDRAELAQLLVHSLLDSDYRDGSDESPSPASFWRAMRDASLPSFRTEQKGVPSRDEIALAYFERLGALPSRKGGRRFLLSKQRLLRLYEEALDISKTVRSWEPSSTMIEKLKSVVRSDSTWEPTTRELELARADRPETRSKIREYAHVLRFPFLMREEIEFIRSSDTTPEGLARWLVLRRLPGLDVDAQEGSLQRLLSGARSASS